MSDLNLNDPPANPPANSPALSSNTSEVSELRSLCDALQAQTHTLRVVLLFVVAALCLFFWREASYNGFAIAQMQQQVVQATQYVEFLNKQGSSFEKQLVGIQSAVARLMEYGKTHPDYLPILAKYGVPVQAAPAGTPAKPAAAPGVPKK